MLDRLPPDSCIFRKQSNMIPMILCVAIFQWILSDRAYILEWSIYKSHVMCLFKHCLSKYQWIWWFARIIAIISNHICVVVNTVIIRIVLYVLWIPQFCWQIKFINPWRFRMATVTMPLRAIFQSAYVNSTGKVINCLQHKNVSRGESQIFVIHNISYNKISPHKSNHVFNAYQPVVYLEEDYETSATYMSRDTTGQTIKDGANIL